MNLAGLWDDAIEIQGQLSDCYEALSRTKKNGAARELKTLAAEERDHVSVLLAGKSVALGVPEAGPSGGADGEIEAGLESARELWADISDGRLDLSEALSRLALLEERFEKVFLEAAIKAGDFSLKKLFEALAKAEAEHRHRLGRLLAGLRGPLS